MISFNGAYDLKKRTLGCICSHGTTECKDNRGVIFQLVMPVCGVEIQRGRFVARGFNLSPKGGE